MLMRESVSRKSVDKTPQKKSIFKDGDRWYVTLDGVHGVETPKALGESLHNAMRFQKVANVAIERARPGRILEILRMLNCRKGALMLSGNISFRDATSSEYPSIKDIKVSPRKALESGIRDIDGVLDLMRDVDRLLRRGVHPIMSRGHEEKITATLDVQKKFPCIVHLFGLSAESAMKMRMKSMDNSLRVEDFFQSRLALYHTFIVLGKDRSGTYICFHKQGPSVYQEFEPSDLDSILNYNLPLDGHQHHMAMIGPLGSRMKAE
jgi:hypothetical protein